MINVSIQNETEFKFKYKRLYKKIVKATLEELSISGDAEVSVIICDNSFIKNISKNYRDKDAATDILSFPAGYKELKPMIGYNLLGDIYLSYQKVEEQANSFGHSSKREWSYLFAHGVLHLLGYDHKTPKDEKEMNGIAYKVMEKVKVGRDA